MSRRDELCKRYRELDREFERNKAIRSVIPFLCVAGFVFYLLYKFEFGPSGLWGFLLSLWISVFVSGIHWVINASYFGWMATKSYEESQRLDNIKKEIMDIDDVPPILRDLYNR